MRALPSLFCERVEEGFTVPLRPWLPWPSGTGPSSSSWVEEGFTIPLRPALRSTAFGGRLSSAGP